MNQIREDLYINSIMNIQDIRYIKDHEILSLLSLRYAPATDVSFKGNCVINVLFAFAHTIVCR